LGGSQRTVFSSIPTAVNDKSMASVPEPSTLALCGFGRLGLAGMGVLRSKPVDA